MFVRLLGIDALFNEGPCRRKHISALNISAERPSIYNVSNRVACNPSDAVVTLSMGLRILTFLRKWIDGDDALVGLGFEAAFQPIDSR